MLHAFLATEERMRYKKLLNASEVAVTVAVGSLWWQIVGTSLVGTIE